MLKFTAIIVGAVLLFASTLDPSLQSNIQENLHPNRRLKISRFSDPKSVTRRSPHPKANAHAAPRRRTNCQIVYVLGVEGSIHHGFMPVIRSLAERQVDPSTGTPYGVVKGHADLRATIFGSLDSDLPLDDPRLVRETVDRMCPPIDDDGRRKVIIEGNSFPSGGADNERFGFRVRRQRDWIGMPPEDIASSESARSHPTNLDRFYDAFAPHVDVRFVVLHRPYLDTVASHIGWDDGPINHSNIIGGFLMVLSRFLMGHMYADAPNGAPLWTIVCADKLGSAQYRTQREAAAARARVLDHLAEFLGWPQRSCPRCFDGWRESDKTPPEERMPKETITVLSKHVKALEGIWPPRRREDHFPEQQCRM